MIIIGDDYVGIKTLKCDLAHRFATPDGVPLSNPRLYHIIFDSPVYFNVTRHDITHAVYMVSQFIWFTLLSLATT